MTTPKKPTEDPQPMVEEIEWTDEDDAIMDKAWADLRARGVKADPVYPVRKPKQRSSVTKQSSETPSS